MRPAVIHRNGHAPSKLLGNGMLHMNKTHKKESTDSPMDERRPLEPAESWYLVNATARSLDGFWHQFLLMR